MAHDESMTSRPSRRTIAKGAAWAVPAAAVVAVPAPAYAVSGPVPTLVYLGACKFPGNSCSRANKGYGFAFSVTNTDPVNTVYFCNASLTNVVPPFAAGTTLTWSPPVGGCVEVAPLQSGTIIFYFTGTGNSANLDFTATLNVEWGHTCPCSNDPQNHPDLALAVNVAATPPGGICGCDADFIPAP